MRLAPRSNVERKLQILKIKNQGLSCSVYTANIPRLQSIFSIDSENIWILILNKFLLQEARHHHHKQKIYLTPLEPYSNVYNQPPLPIYYQYNSYPQSYPAVNYNTENVYSYPYDNVPSIVVNAGGPFLGQTQPRDMQAGSESQSQVASEASDLSNTQKREADPAQLKTAAQNEITQQQFEKTRTIKEAIAGAIKMTGKT